MLDRALGVLAAGAAECGHRPDQPGAKQDPSVQLKSAVALLRAHADVQGNASTEERIARLEELVAEAKL